jgi:FlaA1/EpsC-like NDP-sugar epimerase
MGILSGPDSLWSYRHQKLTTSLEVLVDVLFLAAAAILSFVIRLDTLRIQEFYLEPMAIFTLTVMALRPALLHVFGLYGQTWRYAGPRELLLLVAATSFGSFILALLVFGLLLPLRVWSTSRARSFSSSGCWR